ncbi:hypothetical protein ACFLX7_00630 [Chloroflexota bacterium]
MLKKTRNTVIYLSLMIIAFVLSGCSSGISQEQYEQLQSELTSSQQQLEELNTKIEDLIKANAEFKDLVDNSAILNEELSAITAYLLWYDYYYEIGISDFNDIETFNSQLGSLIAATGDTNSQQAFEIYYQADSDLNAITDSLPEDNILTVPQFESWYDAGFSREEALGQVGGHLLNRIVTIPWFAVD